MMRPTAPAIETLGHRAGNLAALCHQLGLGLMSDPDTAILGDALEGLHDLARNISNDLLDIAEGTF